MLSGFLTTKADTATVSSQSSDKKRRIIPITTRHAILRNSSSSYKSKRKVRARQLQSLHNKIVKDDKQWEEFHDILQQTIEHKGITNSTVKALLFDALNSFQTKESVDVRDRNSNETSKKILKINDIPQLHSVTKINATSITKVDKENDGHKLKAKQMLTKDKENSYPTGISISKKEPVLRSMKKIRSIDSVLDEIMNNFSQLDVSSSNSMNFNSRCLITIDF